MEATKYPRWASYDLVGMIRHQLAISPIEWEGEFVKGHQDKKVEKQKLEEWAKNVLADLNVKQELQRQRRMEECELMEGES